MKSITVKCDACGAEFHVPVSLAGLGVTCACGRALTVLAGGAEAAPGAAPAPGAQGAPGASAQAAAAAQQSQTQKKAPIKLPQKLPAGEWFFSVSGIQVGPMSLQELTARLRQGELERTTQVYNSALKEWVPASDVPGLWRPPASEMPADMWHISVGGRTYGPYTASRMWDMIEQGRLKESSTVWSRSLGEWKRASEVPVFATAWVGGAAAEAGEETPAEEQAVEEKAIEPAEALRRAGEAFDGGRYLEALDLYNKAKGGGGEAPKDRLAEVQEKVKGTYEQAEGMLRDIGDQSAAWNFGEAERIFTELVATEPYVRDEAFRHQADDLKSGLDGARGEVEQQRSEAARLFDAAEKALAEWDMPAASEAMAKLEQIEAVKRDEAFAGKLPDLKSRLAGSAKDMKAHRRAVERLLESVKAKTTEWDFEPARRDLDEAEQKPACKADGELRKLAQELRSQLETAEQKAGEQREKVTSLLTGAEEKLAAWEMPAVFEAIEQLADIHVVARDKELGAKVADLKKRARSTEAKFAVDRQAAEELVEEIRASLAGWKLDVARQQLQEAAQNKACTADGALRQTLEGLQRELEAAAEETSSQLEEVARLAEEIEQKLAKWDMPAAFEAVSRLEGLEIVGRDQTVAEKVAQLKNRAEGGERQLFEQRHGADDLIESARQKMEDQDYDAAKAQLEEAAQMYVCMVDAKLRSRVESVRSELDAIVEELERQRAQAEQLLQQGEEKLAAKNTFGVFEVLSKIEDLDVAAQHDSLASRVAELRRRAESTERELKVQRQEVSELIQGARTRLKGWDFGIARRWLEEAGKKAVCEIDEDLRQQLKELRSEVEAAEAEMATKRVEAATLLAEGEKKLEDRDFAGASAALARLEELEVSKWDRALSYKMADLKQRATIAEDSLVAERKEVPALLEEARSLIASLDLRAARRRIEEAAHKEVCETDAELAQQVERARRDLLAAEEEVESHRTQARRLLADAMTKLAGWDYAAALATVEKLEELEVVRRDQALGARVAEVRDRIEAEQEGLAAERQALDQLCESARAAIDKWDFETARAHLANAEQTGICKIDATVRKQIRTVRSELEAAERDAEAQHDEAYKLLGELERKLAGNDLVGAADAVGSLARLKVIVHDQKLAARFREQEQRTRQALGDASARRAEVVELIQRAKAKSAEGDMEAAGNLLKEAASKEICRLDSELWQQAEAARTALSAVEKGAKHRREEIDRLLREAERKLGQRDLTAVLAALGGLEALGATKLDEGLAPRIADLKAQADKLGGELAEQRLGVTLLLHEAKVKVAEGDFAAARERLGQAAKDKLYEVDADLRGQVEAAQAELQAAEKKAQEQREEAAGLLGQIEKQLQAGEFISAFDLLAKVEALGGALRDEEIKGKLASLREQADKAELDVTAQQQALAQIVEGARAEAAEANFHAAREQIERAAQSALYRIDAEFRQHVETVRAEIETAAERAQQELKHVEEVLQQSTAKLQQGDPVTAARLLQSLAAVDICRRDQEVRQRIRNLKNGILQAIEEGRQKRKAKVMAATQYVTGRSADKTMGSETIMLDSLDALEGAIEGISEVAFVKPTAPVKQAATPPALPKAAAQAPKKPECPAAAAKDAAGDIPMLEELPPDLPAAAKKGTRARAPAAKGTAAQPAGTATPASAASAQKASWYYFKDGQRSGPVTLYALQMLCWEGKLSPKDRVWSQQTVNWVEAWTVPDLKPYARGQTR